MANKRYYWLKLKEDFFENDDIKLIESLPNGKDYIIFYLKLLCKSLKNDGILRYKNIIPYTPEMFSSITNTNIDIVNGALEKFKALNMVDILDDGALYMSDVQNMIGSETNWAKIKRDQRKELDIVQSLSKQCPDKIGNCPTEIEIEKEKETETEKEIEIERDKEFSDRSEKATPKTKIKKITFGEYKHVKLTKEQFDKLCEDYGENIINEYIKRIDEWLQMNGKKPYKDFNLALRNWLNRDNIKKRSDNYDEYFYRNTEPGDRPI